MQLRILDEHGRPIPGYEYRSIEEQAWWSRQPLRVSEVLVLNNRAIGHVEVGVSYDTLLLTTGAIFLGCLGLGVSLALGVYIAPMRVVRRMELRLNALVSHLQRSRDALSRRAEENVHLVETLQQTLTDLKVKNTELDSFVYSASHDLKAPLVALQGMSSLLLEDYGTQLDEDGRFYIERIQINAQYMERLIMDLLALSRVGREARAPEAVSLNTIVDDWLAEQANLICEHGVTVCCGELGEVWAIRTQIEQVLNNLLGNALKYLGDASTPTVEIGAKDDGTYIECYVRDNGIGIDPMYHEKVFEVFQRLKEIDVDGSGVGLAIVKKIVDAAGGRLWVESARGQGATFRFTWPKQVRRLANAAQSISSDSPRGGQPGSCHADDAGIEGWQLAEQGVLGEGRS